MFSRPFHRKGAVVLFMILGVWIGSPYAAGDPGHAPPSRPALLFPGEAGATQDACAAAEGAKTAVVKTL